MAIFSTCSRFGIPLLVIAATVGTPVSAGAASSSFATLLGTWGGTGSYKLEDGTSEKLRCNGYYTGASNQLGLVVMCSGGKNKIEVRSKLTANGTALSGNWEERTYNAEGTVSGRHEGNRISLSVSGSITGTMNIAYDGGHQTVSIALQGSPLKSVNVSLSRK
jgi:hypothetical protein